MIRFLFWAIIAFAAVKTYPDGFAHHEKKTVSADVISETKANQLFATFVADTSIPFDYPIDGCTARAMAMVRIADTENISMAKVYAEGVLRVKNVSKHYPELTWGFHVAPIIAVKTAAGKVVDMVFDPSIFDRPVPLDEWLQKLQTPADPGYPETELRNVYYGSRFQYGRRDFENSRNNWRTLDLEISKSLLEEYREYAKLTPRDSSSKNTDTRPATSSSASDSQPAKGAQ